MPKLLIFASWWAFLYGLWLLLVFRLDLAELVTGAVCSAVALGVVLAVKRETRLGFRPRPASLLPLLRLPWRAVADAARVFAALPRRPRGSIRKVPYEAGDARDPEELARRTLAVWSGSFSANELVLDVDEDEGVMLVHRLVSR